jgi:hypothetical protein
MMAGEELVPLPMDTEVSDIRAWISAMKIQETAEKTALFFAPAKSTSSSYVSALIHRYK